MAGATGRFAPTVSIDPRHSIVGCNLHQRATFDQSRLVLLTIVGDENYSCHVNSSFSGVIDESVVANAGDGYVRWSHKLVNSGQRGHREAER